MYVLHYPMQLARRLSDLIKFSSDVSRVIAMFWLMCIAGLLSLIFPAGSHVIKGEWHEALTVIGAGLFLAGASVISGGLLGFLFGVPRYRRNDESPILVSAQVKADADARYNHFTPNTNLEQISDWLTKVIVGVGLVELRSIVDFFQQIALYNGPAFGSSPIGELLAGCIVIHYLLVGFFQGFLLASLYLPSAFYRASNMYAQQARDTAVTEQIQLSDPISNSIAETVEPPSPPPKK